MPATASPVCAIFDLDGLLVDSEPLWVRAQIECFAAVGLQLAPVDCATTTGLRIDEVAAHWFSRRPWAGPPPDRVAAAVVERVEALLCSEGQARPGAPQAVRLLQAQGVPLALASSSARRLIDAALERLDLQDAFPVVCSAEGLPLGKPHPGVYLAAAAALGADPRRCIALEDSLNGVVAAYAARMGCIAVPEGSQRLDPRFKLADVVLPSLAALDLPAWRTVLRVRGLDGNQSFD